MDIPVKTKEQQAFISAVDDTRLAFDLGQMPVAFSDKDLLNMALNADASHQQKQPEPLDANTRKIESKDSMWKPAPIIGREMTMASKVSVNPGAVN